MFEETYEDRKVGEQTFTVDITFKAHYEHIPPEDVFEEDHAQAAWIRRELDAGNPSAWFCAEVTAELQGFTYSTYLGCCSYESFEQFTSEEDGYFRDMVGEVTDGLLKKFADLRETCTRLGAV